MTMPHTVLCTHGHHALCMAELRTLCQHLHSKCTGSLNCGANHHLCNLQSNNQWFNACCDAGEYKIIKAQFERMKIKSDRWLNYILFVRTERNCNVFCCEWFMAGAEINLHHCEMRWKIFKWNDCGEYDVVICSYMVCRYMVRLGEEPNQRRGYLSTALLCEFQSKHIVHFDNNNKNNETFKNRTFAYIYNTLNFCIISIFVRISGKNWKFIDSPAMSTNAVNIRLVCGTQQHQNYGSVQISIVCQNFDSRKTHEAPNGN